jgi:hypothetical protein
MEEPTETINHISNSEEIRRFYRALALTQANIFVYMSKGVNPKEIKARAVEIAEKLEIIAVEYEDQLGGKVHKCEDQGKVWNPLTQHCE